MKFKKEHSYFIFAALISFVISTFECLPIAIFNFGSWTYHIFGLVPNVSFYLWYALSFLSVLVSFTVAYMVLKPYSTDDSKKKSGFAKSLFISTAVVFSLSILLYQFTDIDRLIILYASIPSSLIISSVATIYAYFIRLNNTNQNIELENEILKKENIKSQYEALKSNLSPHFLFNSLSALQALIRDKPDVANEYVSHLSVLLRYALQRNDEKYIRLSDEMTLTRSFIFLLKMRYGENLIIETHFAEKEKNWKILPFTIQPLIENAVKHNEISEQNPLEIKIEIDSSGFLVISNNIQEKITSESSLGFGLSNLSGRYQMISGKEIQISRANNQFRVTVPLIYSDHEGSDN
jgi:sensor histidine kinase YesM